MLLHGICLTSSVFVFQKSRTTKSAAWLRVSPPEFLSVYVEKVRGKLKNERLRTVGGRYM